MKICAIICEYNPFHNGHLYQIREAKRLSGADAVLCLMSGNFVQRGDASLLNKYTRAKHAVLAGADAVIELPTVFATSNAELFAKGSAHLLSSIPEVHTLCFGAENATKESFIKAAELLNKEPQEISERIKTLTASGISYAKARADAWKELLPIDLLTQPNNILGLEYARAILSKTRSIELLPIQRIGKGYKDENLQENYSSASAIRSALNDKRQIRGNLPSFVYNDLPLRLEESLLDALEKYAILQRDTKEIAAVCDCTEGLENAFKRAAEQTESLVSVLTSPRYTSARIRRIALQNLLQIPETLIREALTAPSYLRLLAINETRKELLTALSHSTFPLLVRAHDEDVLSGVAKECLERDRFAEKVHALLYPKPIKTDIFI